MGVNTGVSLSLGPREPERKREVSLPTMERKDSRGTVGLPRQEPDWERERRDLLSRFELEKKTLSKDLSLAQEELSREKERSSLLNRDHQNLKSTLERANSELMQIAALRDQMNSARKDIDKYKRFAEESSLDLNIMKKEKEMLEANLREMEDIRRKNDDLAMEIRRKDEEIVDLRRPRRSAEFDAILRELNELRFELDRLNFDPVVLEIHGKSERLKTLLTDKTTQVKLMHRNQVELEGLQRENSTLKKQNLELNSKLLGEKEEHHRSKANLQALQLEKEIFQREITRLREIINEYVNSRDRKDEAQPLDPAQLTEDAERQARVLQEEIFRSESSETKAVKEMDTLKAEFKSAIMKIDNISDRVR